MTDIVCAEGELSAAVKKIQQYIEFLQNSIADYSRLVSSVEGIKDQRITRQLKLLAAEVAKQNQALSELSRMTSETVMEHISDIEAADNFRYPDIGAEGIRALLSGFF